MSPAERWLGGQCRKNNEEPLEIDSANVFVFVGRIRAAASQAMWSKGRERESPGLRCAGGQQALATSAGLLPAALDRLAGVLEKLSCRPKFAQPVG